jgi:hypothetical protein
MPIYNLILRRDDRNADGRRKECPDRGYFFEAFLNGEPLSRSQVNAETDACRELLRRGLTGKARFWREGKATPDLEMKIEVAAKVQLIKSDQRGFRWRRYREFPDASWRKCATATGRGGNKRECNSIGGGPLW